MCEKILFVDDEPNVLNAYKRALHKQFQMDFVDSGQKAIEHFANHGPYAVIVSDMRMPEMDGIKLLSIIKNLSPNTVRVMLTGNTDQQTAIDAVNQGDIFRFLNKPCNTDVLANTLQSSIRQYQLITAEKELLQKTLGGSIRALTEILSLANPVAFNCIANVRKNFMEVIQVMGIIKEWWMEPMVLLSQIGCVILPSDVLNKVAKGESLNEEERQLFQQHPLLGADMLTEIPRFENVVEGIRYQEKHFDGGGIPRTKVKGEDIPIGARLLKPLLDFDRYKVSGLDNAAALNELYRQKERYDPNILEALASIYTEKTLDKSLEMKFSEIREGMVIAQDVMSQSGHLIVNAGQEITTPVYRILSNFSKRGNLIEPLLVEFDQIS